MPTRGRSRALLVDTSVAVALVVADHEHHDTTFEAIGARRLGLAGHAAFETYSVLTRLPSPARRSAATIAEVLVANFPETRFPSRDAAARLFATLAQHGIGGGSVYDALIGVTAVEHGLPLASRDRRALQTYSLLDVEVELLG